MIPILWLQLRTVISLPLWFYQFSWKITEVILLKYHAFLGGKIEDSSFLFTSGKFILFPMFMKAIISDSLNSENNIRKLGGHNQQKGSKYYYQELKFCLNPCCCFLLTCFRVGSLSWPYLGLLNCSLNAL